MMGAMHSAVPMGLAMRGPPPMMMGAPAGGMPPPPMPSGCGAPMAMVKMKMAHTELKADMLCEAMDDMDDKLDMLKMGESRSAPKRDMASEAYISSTVSQIAG